MNQYLPQRIARPGVPRNFAKSPHGDLILHAGDFGLVAKERGAVLKVLVFSSNAKLRQFWNKALGDSSLCRRTAASVKELGLTVYGERDGDLVPVAREVDPRYFAIAGFIRGRIDPEIVAHECVHAAFAYDRRRGDRNRFRKFEAEGMGALNEERIAYPVGRLTDALTRWFRELDLLNK